MGAILISLIILSGSVLGLAQNMPAIADAEELPPQIVIPASTLPQFIAPAAFIPDIPWQPPSPRLNVNTPFAPKFLKGNNIFVGEKEAWLADAVASTEHDWPSPLADAPVCDYLTQLTQYLGRYSHEPGKHYEIHIVNSYPPNAFTAGGGKIYVTAGLLRAARNEDELAGIIAHEIGHDNFHHTGRTVTRKLFWMTGKQDVTSAADTKLAIDKLLVAYRKNIGAAMAEAASGISRADEQSADKAAVYFLYKAGYNPHAMGQFLWRTPDPMVQYVMAEDPALFPIFYGLILLFDSHPPNYWRTMSIEWESNFVTQIPKNVYRDPTAFDAMKSRLKYLDDIEAARQREARAKAMTTKKADTQVAPSR